MPALFCDMGSFKPSQIRKNPRILPILRSLCCLTSLPTVLKISSKLITFKPLNYPFELEKTKMSVFQTLKLFIGMKSLTITQQNFAPRNISDLKGCGN